jgi:hypothetical protein
VDNNKLLDKYEIASKKIKQQLNSPKGGSSAEAEYSAAYQALVKAGLAMQIKKKYRSK